MSSFKSIVLQHILTPFSKSRRYCRNVVFTYVVFLYRIPLQFLSPPFANPACSRQSVTIACSIQNGKNQFKFPHPIFEHFVIQFCNFYDYYFSHLWTFFQSFYNTLHVNLSHQLSINSDAVLNLTRRVYCTRFRSVDNHFNRSYSVCNRFVYSSLIRQ